MLIITNAIWGATFPMMKGLNFQVDSHFGVTDVTASGWLRCSAAAWMISIRFGLALAMFVVFFRGVMRRVGWPHVISGATMGVFFFFGLLVQVIGLGTISASRSGFLTSLAVVFTPLFSTILRRRLPRGTVMAGVVFALAGVSVLTEMVVIGDGSVRVASDALQRWTWGDSLTIVGACFFSCHILLVDVLGKRYESIAFTPGMFAMATVLGAVTFGLLKTSVPEIPIGQSWTGLAVQPQFFGLIAALGLFPSLLAFAWMNKYQPYLSAVQAAVIYTSEPFFASTWAMFLPGILAVLCSVPYVNESFSSPLLVGGVLILTANVLALWPQKSSANESANDATIV
ncbi:MAG: DMT family transporter [Rubripirellula sp.]